MARVWHNLGVCVVRHSLRRSVYHETAAASVSRNFSDGGCSLNQTKSTADRGYLRQDCSRRDMRTVGLGRLGRCLPRANLLHHNTALSTAHRHFHTSSMVRHKLEARDDDQDEQERSLVKSQEAMFDDIANANKVRNSATFKMAVARFVAKESVYRRGHVEFLYASLKQMKPFGVHRDLEAYKLLFDLFPKGKMVAETMWQVEMTHYPKQQQCAIDILCHMEDHGVLPDDALGRQLIAIFGKRAHAFRKYQRMMYWMPKFKYANPYYVPQDLPSDRTELAVLAIKRMAVDLQNKVDVFRAEDVDNSYDHTFIVSGQSPQQQRLIADHPAEAPMYVEGGFTTWLRGEQLLYFVLRSAPTDLLLQFQQQEQQEEQDTDDTRFSWNFYQEERMELVVPPSVHQQSDGTILAMCITGTGSKDSLASWIKCLEGNNPRLASVPVVFLLRTPEHGVQVTEQTRKDSSVMV